MNRFNKNILHRTICILLLLTLCTGLCFEATALPVTMVTGRYYDLGEGYSIRVVQTDFEGEKAWFMLHKEGGEVDSEVVADGHLLDFNDGDVFHFDASVHVVAMSTVELSSCNCRGLCFEAFASGKSGKKTLAEGKDWELVRDYSIRAVKIHLYGNEAELVLNKDGKVVDTRDVSGDDWFILDDGENFYFEATVDVIFRGTDTNIVQLKPFSWEWWMAVGEPHNLQASAGDGYVDISWDVPDTDCGYPITGYKIYRGTSSGDESHLVSVGTPEISYKDTAVTNGQTYHYYVTAINDAGESSPSSEASAKPQGPPSPPQNLQAVAGDGYVDMSWDEPDDDGGSTVTGYNVYSGTTPGGEKTLLTKVGNVLTYTDNDVTNGQTYYYHVSAVNIAGEGTMSEEVDATPTSGVTPPQAPSNLQKTAGDGYVELSWDAPADDPESSITEYVIYRDTTPGGGRTVLTTVDKLKLTYTDNDVTSGQTYYYQVSAVNIAGEGTMSEEVDATLTSPPSAPERLQTKGGDGYVDLSWDAPADDGGSLIIGYVIYNSTTSGGGKTLLTRLGNRLTYTDKNVTNGQTYYYQVSAVNIAGEGIDSNEESATPEKKYNWPLIVAMIAAAATIVAAIYNCLSSRYGSISASSNPDGVRVFIDGVNKGESPLQMDKIRKGARIVLFKKSGYSDCEKKVIVNANQTTAVHCDLKKPETTLRLSAEPTEIPADGKSKSVITISVEDEEGTPAPVPEEMTIVLETDIGLIDTPVSIPAGDAQTRSILTSSTAGGTATVRAKSDSGLEGSVAFRFA